MKSFDMISTTLKWRKDFGTDSILSDFDFPELPELKLLYPHGYHKTCKLGRPIYIEQSGRLDLKKVLQLTTEDRLLKYFVSSYEKYDRFIFPSCSKAAEKRIE